MWHHQGEHFAKGIGLKVGLTAIDTSHPNHVTKTWLVVIDVPPGLAKRL